MRHKYKFRNQEGMFFITFGVVRWVDVFTRDIYREILIDSIKHCQIEKGLILHGYVIMTNHVHFIASAKPGFFLSNIMRDLKKFTSVNIINAIMGNSEESRKSWMLKIFEFEGSRSSFNTKYKFWQNGNHPIELTDNKIMDQKLGYIHNNPVKAGFVIEPEYYPYSSARDYAGMKGYLDVDLLL